MATNAKVEYKYEKLSGITSVEIADPAGRLQKGVTVTSGIELRRPAVGTALSVKVKPLPEKKEPLAHTYDGALTGMYVAPKRDGGINFTFNVSIDKVETAGETVTKEEAEEAINEIFRLIRLKKEGKWQEEIDHLLAEQNVTPAA